MLAKWWQTSWAAVEHPTQSEFSRCKSRHPSVCCSLQRKSQMCTSTAWSWCQQRPRPDRQWNNTSMHSNSEWASWSCPISGWVGCQQRPRPDRQWSNASFYSSWDGAPWSCPISGWVRCQQRPDKTDDGMAPLYIAAQEGQLEVVRFLLGSGANKDQGTTDDGATPLYIAAQEGHLEVVRFLVESGANKDQGRTDNGATPLFVAAQIGHLEVVRFLVESGANKDQGRTIDGATPLIIASQNGHGEVVRFIGGARWQHRLQAGMKRDEIRVVGNSWRSTIILPLLCFAHDMKWSGMEWMKLSGRWMKWTEWMNKPELNWNEMTWKYVKYYVNKHVL